MNRTEQIIHECQNRLLLINTDVVFTSDTPTDHMKTLAYVAGVNDMANELIDKLGGKYEKDEDRISEMEIDLSEAEACLREQQGCN